MSPSLANRLTIARRVASPSAEKLSLRA